MNTPQDMLQLVIDTNREHIFLSSMMRRVGNYSIGEIPDSKFIDREGRVSFHSNAFDIHMKLDPEDEITGAILAGRYVNAFISRFGNERQVHFMIHGCLAADKAEHEETIAKKSVQYMIFQTIVALRLDSRKKLENYMEGVY